MRAVVIGAGISGLVAARTLSRGGVSTQVVEARDRVGGRVLTRGGVDLGASWVWDTETHVQGLLAELGIETFAHHREGVDLYQDGVSVHRVRLPRSSVPERRVVGGPAAIAHALAADVDVVLGTPVRSVVEGERGLEVRSAGRVWDADHVVVAVPPSVFVTQVETPGLDEADALRRTGVWMADVAKVVAVYPRRFWREAGLSGRVASRVGPMGEIHDLSGRDGDPAALFGFVHRSSAPADLGSAVVRQLVALFGPEAGDPVALHVQAWWTEPETAGAPGSDVRWMGHARLREPWLGGRLWFCSTETSALSPGHIDGAVERGRSVAERIARG